MNQSKIKEWSYNFILIIATLFKLVTANGLAPYAISNSAYDDMLFINQAQAFASGNWLGEFSKTTLLKRPMFTIFMGLVEKLSLSYKLTVQFVYIVAVILFVYVIGQIIQNKKVQTILYLVLLFSPSMYCFIYVQRVYRMALIPAAVLFVVTGVIALFGLVHKKTEWKLQMAMASVFLGLSLFYFWNLREDSVWIVPFVACGLMISAGIVVYQFVKSKDSVDKKARYKELVLRGVFLILPVIICLLGNSGIKYMNYRHYGVYTDSEMNHSEFASLMSTIYSVECEEEYQYVNVDKKTFYKILEQSETMQSLQPHIDEMFDGGWTMDNGQIAGGYIAYAFRDVLKKAGYYESDALAKEAICKQINEEIKTAIAEGRLTAKGGLFSISFLMGKKGANTSVFVPKYLESLKWVTAYEKMTVQRRKSTGSVDYLKQFEKVTNNLVIYPDEWKVSLKGYAYAKNGTDQMKLFVSNKEDSDGKEIGCSLSSMDVYQFFAATGEEQLNMLNCRFEYKAGDMKDTAFVRVLQNGVEVQRIPLKDLVERRFETDDYVVNFDEADLIYIEDPYFYEGSADLKLTDFIIKCYKFTAYPVLILAIVAWIILGAAMFMKQFKANKETIIKGFIVLSGLLLSALLVMGGVTFRYAEARNSSGRTLYMAGAYPLYHIFTVGCIAFAWIYVMKPMIKDMKGKENK